MLRLKSTIVILAALARVPDVTRADFTTVINAPPDPVPSGVGGGTQLNLFDGGYIRENYPVDGSYSALGRAELNVYGGTVGPALNAYKNAVVNIYGGSVGSLAAHYQGYVNIMGGAIDSGIVTEWGSNATISGSDFRLNGVPIAGLETVGNSIQPNLTGRSVLSGTLSDGTPFVFDQNAGNIVDGTLHLNVTALPPVGPADIHTSNSPIPIGLRSGQTLTVDSEVEVNQGMIAGPGSTVNLAAGNVRSVKFKAVGSTVNISGGWHDSTVTSYLEGVINILGGSIYAVTAGPGGVLNMTGGRTDYDGATIDGGTGHISGGHIYALSIHRGGIAEISGGSVGGASVYTGSELNVLEGRVGGIFSEASKIGIQGGTIQTGSHATRAATHASQAAFMTESAVDLRRREALIHRRRFPNQRRARLGPFGSWRFGNRLDSRWIIDQWNVCEWVAVRLCIGQG